MKEKLCPSPSGDDELFILCRSSARREKERAIHDRFIQRLTKGLTKLKKSCELGRVKNARLLERRIGRLLEKYNRASPLFDVNVTERDGRLDLAWTIQDAHTDWARLSEGCYLLRTNIKDWTPEDLWRRHSTYTNRTWPFDPSGTRGRIAFRRISWSVFSPMCSGSVGNEPRVVLEEIKNLNLVDVVLQTRKGVEIRLRCVSKPDNHLAILLQKLDLHVPARLEMKHNL